MPFKQYGINPTIESISRQRGDDMTVIAQLEGGKLAGRDRTGIRATPSAFNNLLQGDMLGDVVNTSTHRYTLILLGGSLVWAKAAHDTAF